jgi:hypothetical protein
MDAPEIGCTQLEYLGEPASSPDLHPSRREGDEPAHCIGRLTQAQRSLQERSLLICSDCGPLLVSSASMAAMEFRPGLDLPKTLELFFLAT